MMVKVRDVALALVAATVVAGTATAASFERIVGFGDSLTDPGNAFVLTGEYEVRPFDPVPDAAYLIGGFRFTNGPVWLEVLADGLDTRRSGRPAFLLPGINGNYAIGSARARPGVNPAGLDAQIGVFLATFKEAPEDWLYAFFIGGNDLRDAAAAFATNRDETQSIIADAVAGTIEGIGLLAANGARSFLVLNLPNIGATPSAREQGARTAAAGRRLTLAYNRALGGALDGLEQTQPDLQIIRFDVFSLLEDAVRRPRRYGLRNVTDSCITPDVIFGAICRRPDRYLFWDFIHPTRAAHKRIGEEVMDTIGAQAALLAQAD